MKKGESSTNGFTLPDGPTDWESIDWIRVRRDVRHKQKRIANAARDGDWRRVKSLQGWLTVSFYAKALAIRKAVGSLPKRADGVDKRSWASSQNKFAAIAQLPKMGSRPLKLLGQGIAESRWEMHPLGIQTMLKKATQILYFMAFDPALDGMCVSNPHPWAQVAGTSHTVAVDARALA